MSDLSVPTVDFDDNEYVWPVGDVPGVPAEQLVPPTPPETVEVTDETWAQMWTGFQRLAGLLHRPSTAGIFDQAADEIEYLRWENTALKVQANPDV
mgnify:CR=1 FL=1